MIRLLAPLLMLAGPIMAQPVTIRSGDHESFVRLVFAIPEGASWEVGRIDGGVGVLLEDLPSGISTEGIFDRIPRNRIEEVSVDDDLVAIRLVCDCHADAFLWRDDRLVVDIVDGQSPPDSPFDRQLSARGDASSEQTPPDVVLPILIPDQAGHATLREALPFQVPDASAGMSMDAAQVAVVTSLARAATEGFFDIPIEPLQLTFPDNGAEDESGRRVVGLTPVTDPMTEIGGMLQADGRPGLLLRSGLTDSTAPDRNVVGEMGSCLPSEQFDVPAWGDDRDFSTQIAERRTALTEEFDRYPDGAIEGLARAYVYFGFGIEARRVLSLDGALTSERLLINELARIVDGGVAPAGLVAGQMECGGAAALWGILAVGAIDGVDDNTRGEAIRAFRNLPRSLREHLGPRLASLFVDAGAPERGEEIIELVDRQDTIAPVEVDLVRADIDATAGDVGSQQDRLGALAEDNARMPPAALAELLLLQVELGEPPPTELIELGQVYLHEARPSGGDIDLAAAVVRAWIARSELAMAERALDEAVPSDSGMFGPLYNELLSAKVQQFSDRDFLELALSDPPHPASSRVEHEIADRLLELGFPRQALAVVDTPSEPGSELERRYLRASAFAQQGDVGSVDLELEGLRDARARDIRIDALARAGDYSDALEEARSGEDREGQSELAWRAGDWEALENSDDELFQSVSRLVQQPTFLAPSLAELEARNALLEDAVRTRRLAEELLGRFSLEEPSSGSGQ